MIYEPLSEVVDEPLIVNTFVIEQLRTFRHSAKLVNLPGVNVTEERERLAKMLDDLADRLLQGIEKNPTKLWVLTQFQATLELVEGEDTEGRDHFGIEIEAIMEIFGIESSDGLLTCYLGGM